jgi:hypothetical protein
MTRTHRQSKNQNAPTIVPEVQVEGMKGIETRRHFTTIQTVVCKNQNAPMKGIETYLYPAKRRPPATGKNQNAPMNPADEACGAGGIETSSAGESDMIEVVT